jgi:hypothetical protein
MARDFSVVLRLLQDQETATTWYKARDILVVLRLMKDTLREQSLTSSVKELRGKYQSSWSMQISLRD